MVKANTLITIMKTFKTRLMKFMLLATLFLGFAALMPEPVQAASDVSLFSITSGTAEAKFGALQTRIKGFAVVVLLIMLVIAGLMAAFQKVQWAINIAIGSIILFGGAYIILLVSEGLS